MAPLIRRPVLVLALVAVGVAATSVVPVGADSDIDDLRGQREENRRDAAEVAAQIDALNAEDRDLVEALEALDAHIALQEGKVAAAERRIAVAERQADDARAEAAALGTHMEAIRERLRARAVDVYVAPRRDALDQLNSGDLLQTALRQSFLSEVVGDEYELVDQLRTAQADQDAAQRVADAAAADARAEQAELDVRLDELADARAEAEELRAEVQFRIADWEAVNAEIAAADAEIAAEIRRLEEALARQAAEEAAAARRAAEEAAAQEAAEADEAAEDGEAGGAELEITEPVAVGGFTVTHRPVPGPVTSSFGPRMHPIFGTTRPHNGIDFDGDTGDPIVAAASGNVLMAGWINGYGNTVVISHGNGFTTLYAHQDSIAVVAGDAVDGGQTIGFVGSTGWSTGPHLHWEIRVEGIAVDPALYI